MSSDIIILIVGVAFIAYALYRITRTRCPVCDGENVERVHLVYPRGRKAYVCHDCIMWFDKKA